MNEIASMLASVEFAGGVVLIALPIIAEVIRVVVGKKKRLKKEKNEHS